MNSLFRNSIFNFASQIIIFLAALILSIFMARILGPEQMGKYSYFMWLIGTGAVILTLGIPRSLTRFVAQYKSNNDSLVTKLVSRTVIYQTKILISILLVGIVLICLFGGDQKLTYFIILAGLFFTVLNSLLGSVLTGLQRYNLLLRINLLISPLSFFLSIFILLFFNNLNNLLMVNLLVAFFSLAVSIYYLRDHLKLSAGKIPANIFLSIKNYTLSISIIVFLDLILMERSEIFFLKNFSTLKQLAFYSISFGLVSRLMTLIPGAVSGVIMPKIAWLHGKKDPKNIKLTYYSSTRYLILITLPIIFSGIALVDLPINIFYGQEYLDLIPVISILLISGGLSAIVASAAAVLYGTGNQNFILKLAGVAALVNILLDILLIPTWGAIGAAIANSLAQILGAIVGTGYLVKVKKMIFPWLDGLKILIASLVTGILIYTLQIFFPSQTIFSFIILIMFYGIIYLALLSFLKFFIKQDVDILKRLTDRFIKI